MSIRKIRVCDRCGAQLTSKAAKAGREEHKGFDFCSACVDEIWEREEQAIRARKVTEDDADEEDDLQAADADPAGGAAAESEPPVPAPRAEDQPRVGEADEGCGSGDREVLLTDAENADEGAEESDDEKPLTDDDFAPVREFEPFDDSETEAIPEPTMSDAVEQDSVFDRAVIEEGSKADDGILCLMENADGSVTVARAHFHTATGTADGAEKTDGNAENADGNADTDAGAADAETATADADAEEKCADKEEKCADAKENTESAKEKRCRDIKTTKPEKHAGTVNNGNGEKENAKYFDGLPVDTSPNTRRWFCDVFSEFIRGKGHGSLKAMADATGISYNMLFAYQTKPERIPVDERLEDISIYTGIPYEELHDAAERQRRARARGCFRKK